MSQDYYDEEDDTLYIFDQGKSHIQTIIKKNSEKYENESDLIQILLSDHYKDFRVKFFERVKHTHKSIYQDIKNQIRNHLNPYKVYLKKDVLIPNELIELSALLKGHFKDKNVNNTFFINYFRELEERNKNGSKLVDDWPKDEIETLNDIQRKVKIIKNLTHYLNTNLSKRIQTNFEIVKDQFCSEDMSLMMYQYLVIDEE